MARAPQPAARGGDGQDITTAGHPDDRALDRLADRGPSRVGVEGAMRARDVSRPGPADLAAAATTPSRPARRGR
jgi:hypothetical protein